MNIINMRGSERNILIDDQLQTKISNLQIGVKRWAKKHDLWEGCQFYSYHSFYEDEPNMEEPCLTILSAGDKLISVLKGPL